jgi:hypothetical protein
MMQQYGNGTIGGGNWGNDDNDICDDADNDGKHSGF